MYIKKIKLLNFRNYLNQEIELADGISLFFGDNAQGKTNILEAIFITAIGKSFRAKKEKELINLEKENALIEVEFQKSDRSGKIRIELNPQKNIYINNIKQKKISDILGNINIVMFSPDDIEILKSGAAKRRRFLDIMISQLRPNYVYHLNRYIKALEQRNNYLRQIKYENKSKEMLEIWDQKLADDAKLVQEYRKEFIEKIKGKINKIHANITQEKEKIEIIYTTDCENKEKYIEELKKAWNTDIAKGYTTKGIHRDDFFVNIDNKQVNIYGSQGQNRTVVLSLKLTELEIIQEEIGEYPILLLDDFMSELDKTRRENFLKNIEHTQVLITCTDSFNMQEKVSNSYQVNQGTVQKK